MAASGKLMNTRVATFTPTSGSALTYSGVQSVSIDPGGSLQKFAGDGDQFNTLVVHDFSDVMVSLTLGGVPGAMVAGVGTRGVLTMLLKDARNKSATAESGDITFTVSTAVVENLPITAAFRQFGSIVVSFSAESVDGATSPITYLVTA